MQSLHIQLLNIFPSPCYLLLGSQLAFSYLLRHPIGPLPRLRSLRLVFLSIYKCVSLSTYTIHLVLYRRVHPLPSNMSRHVSSFIVEYTSSSMPNMPRYLSPNMSPRSSPSISRHRSPNVSRRSFTELVPVFVSFCSGQPC